MKFSPLSLSLLTLSLVTTACGTGAKSKLDGHYEEASASSMSAYRGQQIVPAEYAKADGVIVSSELLVGYGREDLVKAILDAGAKKVWVTVSRGSGESLQSSTFSRLRQVLGRDISKVSVVEQKDAGRSQCGHATGRPLEPSPRITNCACSISIIIHAVRQTMPPAGLLLG